MTINSVDFRPLYIIRSLVDMNVSHSMIPAADQNLTHLQSSTQAKYQVEVLAAAAQFC
jgi:hypothetical protein